MKHAKLLKPITPQSVDALCSKLERGPLPPYGQATICCLGCGKHMTVEAGHEREAEVEMKDHALSHAPRLSDDFRASTQDDLPTNDLIATMAWAMAAGERQN